MAPIPRSTVPPVLKGFAQGVTIKSGNEVTSTQSFAEWNKTPSVNVSLQNGRLDKIYSFGVRNTHYKVELVAMWYPNEQSPCWGLAVRHIEWATHLAELERLHTGQQASWRDIIDTFLPEDGGSSSSFDNDGDFGLQSLKVDTVTAPSREGIRILINILLQLSELVSSVTTARGGVQI
jgi:hypothetical protein